jgi:hypothetical protein
MGWYRFGLGERGRVEELGRGLRVLGIDCQGKKTLSGINL